MIIVGARVRWFRTSALCSRWKEEVEILQEEIRRVQRFFAYYRDMWFSRSQGTELDRVSKGACAYAARCAFSSILIEETLTANIQTIGLI